MAYIAVPKDLSKIKAKSLNRHDGRSFVSQAAPPLWACHFFLLKTAREPARRQFVMIVVMLPASSVAMYEETRNNPP